MAHSRHKRAAQQTLVGAFSAPFVLPITYNIDLDATTTRDFPLLRTTFKGRLRAASWTQELAVDGTKTVKVRNITDSVDLTSDLTINGLGADAGAAFVLSTSGLIVPKNKLVAVVYTVTVAGTVAPGEASITLSWEFISD